MISLLRDGSNQGFEDELLDFTAVEVHNLKNFISGFRRLFFGLESRRNPAQRCLMFVANDV